MYVLTSWRVQGFSTDRMTFRQDGGEKGKNRLFCENSPVPFLCFPRKLHPAAPAEAQMFKKNRENLFKNLNNKKDCKKIKNYRKKKEKNLFKFDVLHELKPDQLALKRNPFLGCVFAPISAWTEIRSASFWPPCATVPAKCTCPYQSCINLAFRRISVTCRHWHMCPPKNPATFTLAKKDYLCPFTCENSCLHVWLCKQSS